MPDEWDKMWGTPFHRPELVGNPNFVLSAKYLAATVEMWPLENIKPYEKNTRTHPPQQIELLANLMRRYGVDQPIVVDDQGVILKGHGRRLAALAAGMAQFPVVIHKDLSEQEKSAIRIADNQVTLLGDWDDELLKMEMTELKMQGFDIPMIGFDSHTLDEIFASTDPRAEEAPEKSKNPYVKKGELWILGNHQILCGDATNGDDVFHLVKDRKTNLMVTDPPYGVDYDPDWRNRTDRASGKPIGARAVGKVINDDQADWRKAWALFKGNVAYIWHGGNKGHIVAEGLMSAGLKIRTQIIWAKNNHVISRGHYHAQHEPLFYAVREGANGSWQGDRHQTTLWQIPKNLKSETGHSAQKPVECMKRPIENNSKRGEYIYDPFIGSGTTIIACEMTERKCLAMDIDPGYVQVCIERWQTFTGKTATRDGEIKKQKKGASPKGRP